MKLLSVGGSGFFSGTMVRHALAEGNEVWAVTRGQRPMPAGAVPIIADRKDHPAFATAIAGAKTSWDLVIDCIGFTAEDAQQDLDVFAGRAGGLVFITILRPCHIYGPGSQLGCLPMHGRDPELIAKMKRGEPLKLVVGGYFLQQPIFAKDLAMTAVSCFGNKKAAGQIYVTVGPDVVASRDYYRIVADVPGVPLTIEEVSITEHLAANPGQCSFFCHRVYAMDKAVRDGLTVPAAPLKQGLAEHVRSIL